MKKLAAVLLLLLSACILPWRGHGITQVEQDLISATARVDAATLTPLERKNLVASLEKAKEEIDQAKTIGSAYPPAPDKVQSLLDDATTRIKGVRTYLDGE